MSKVPSSKEESLVVSIIRLLNQEEAKLQTESTPFFFLFFHSSSHDFLLDVIVRSAPKHL